MIKIAHTLQDQLHAIAKANGFDDAKLKNKNHVGGRSRERGMLAEILFAKAFALAFNDKQFKQDFVLGSHLINVKSNHSKTYPMPWYRASVVVCDLPRLDRGIDLVFVHLSFDTEIAYIVGWMPLTKFVNESTKLKHKNVDWRFVTIDQLLPMSELKPDGDLFAGEFCLPQ